MRLFNLYKRDLIIGIFLMILLFFLNRLFFSAQLLYGFRDVDWGMLYHFKNFGDFSFNHLLSAYKLMGAYTYELYYVGFLEKFLGLNFFSLHQATQFFKVLSGVGVYLVVATVFKKRLLAFLSSVIFTISYTHAGALFMLATGGYFFAFIFMCLFLTVYYYSLLNINIRTWILASVLLSLTLILNTERMYPLILLVVIVEVVYIFLGKFNKKTIQTSIIRTILIFLPIIVFSLIYKIGSSANITNTGFSPNQFFIMTKLRTVNVLNGNWQLLLYPFSSFGSMFLHGDYWKYLGQVNTSNFVSYLSFLFFHPLLIFGILSFPILRLTLKESLKYIFGILSATFIFGLIIYWMIKNWLHLDPQIRIHFDPNLTVVPALCGFFVTALAFVFFLEWRKSRNPDFTPLILGTLFAWIFILLTWIASDIQLLFTGPHRYLSIPSMGTSLLTAGLFLLVFNRLRAKQSTRQYAGIIFLILIPLMSMNYKLSSDFFNYELNFAGMRASDQTFMKTQLRNLIKDIDLKDRSLFYFDETEDKNNGYFDESTVLAGFEHWTRVNDDGSLNKFPEPGMIRTNVQCTLHTHSNCMDILKKGLDVVNGEKGVWYKDDIRGYEPRFYKLSNLYAIRFINKNLVNIKDEVLKELDKGTP